MGPIIQSVTLHNTKRLFSDKHSSLLGTFESYEKNEVYWIRPLGPMLWNFFLPYFMKFHLIFIQ